MRADDVALVGGLCLRFPPLRPLLQEHLDDYDGLLPHLFIAEVTRWLVKQSTAADGADSEWCEVLAFLEHQFDSGGENIRELLAVSILENLPQRNEVGYSIRMRLGPSMRAHVEEFLTW